MNTRSGACIMMVLLFAATLHAQQATETGTVWRSAMIAGSYAYTGGRIAGSGVEQRWSSGTGGEWSGEVSGSVLYGRPNGTVTNTAPVLSGGQRPVTGITGSGGHAWLGSIGVDVRWSPAGTRVRPFVAIGPSILWSDGNSGKGVDLVTMIETGVQFAPSSPLSSGIFVRYLGESAVLRSSPDRFRNALSGGMSIAYGW